MELLDKLDAPNLQVIDLSNNNLTVEDVILFRATNFKYLQIILLYPTLSFNDF